MKTFAEKYLKYIVLAAALACLTLGIFRGDMTAVLRKAAAICLECIGIG